MTVRRVVPIVVFLALTWLFGGAYGLAVGAAIVGVALAFRLPARVFYAAAVVFLVAAPIAIIGQGLADTSVAGAGWGTNHLVAHVLVGCSLACAGFAGIVELTKWDEIGVAAATSPPPLGPEERPPDGSPETPHKHGRTRVRAVE